jgi:hypothetical protein
MNQEALFSPDSVPKDQLSVLTPTIVSNGVHDAPQTVIERIQVQTGHYNATYWREKLMQCHVPPQAPAQEWESGINRVATIFYTPGTGAA